MSARSIRSGRVSKRVAAVFLLGAAALFIAPQADAHSGGGWGGGGWHGGGSWHGGGGWGCCGWGWGSGVSVSLGWPGYYPYAPYPYYPGYG